MQNWDTLCIYLTKHLRAECQVEEASRRTDSTNRWHKQTAQCMHVQQWLVQSLKVWLFGGSRFPCSGFGSVHFNQVLILWVRRTFALLFTEEWGQRWWGINGYRCNNFGLDVTGNGSTSQNLPIYSEYTWIVRNVSTSWKKPKSYCFKTISKAVC